MFTPAVSSRVIDGWGSTGVGLFNVNIVGWTHNSSHAVRFAEDFSGGICIYIYIYGLLSPRVFAGNLSGCWLVAFKIRYHRVGLIIISWVCRELYWGE